jgi:hypothetical protein
MQLKIWRTEPPFSFHHSLYPIFLDPAWSFLRYIFFSFLMPLLSTTEYRWCPRFIPVELVGPVEDHPRLWDYLPPFLNLHKMFAHFFSGITTNLSRDRYKTFYNKIRSPFLKRVVYSTGIYESLHFVADQENRIVIKVLKFVIEIYGNWIMHTHTPTITITGEFKKGTISRRK